jgi:PIN domain nuclease of toxin-antitoxin system
MLIKTGKARLSTRFDWWAASLASRHGFDEAALDLAVIAEALTIRINGDPFDEGIVATARVRGLPLITRDEAITQSRLVDVVW